MAARCYDNVATEKYPLVHSTMFLTDDQQKSVCNKSLEKNKKKGNTQGSLQ